MVSSNQLTFSIAALSLSGIAVLTILRKRSSSLKAIGLHRVKGDCDVEIKEGKDFISQLPDELLVEILFHLPTRDSVRTSILSKRWRNLYAYVHLMEFSCLKMFPSEQLDYFRNHKSGGFMKRIFKIFGYKKNRSCGLQENFINGVDTFLRLHSVSSIFSCRLSCCLITSCRNKLREWICSLGKLNIKVLHLDLMCNDIDHEILATLNYEALSLNCKFFSLVPSLLYLRLTGCFLAPTSEIIRPNCLKVLDLYVVTLTPDALSCFLSNCLNLEGLFMENCTIPKSTLRICGSNLQLKSLVIKLCSNLERIELWADNLTYFEYFDIKLIEFSFDHIPKLESFVLTLPYGLNVEKFTAFSRDEIAKALPPVPILSLQIYGQYYEMFTPAGFDILRNVKHLLLGFSMFKPDQISVASVLQMCPVLCEFHLQIEKPSPAFNGQQVMGSLKFHNQLKKVIFTGFSGTKSEVDVVEYFMRSAMVLEKMIISYCFSHYIGRNKWVKEGEVPLKEEICKEIEMLRGHAISKNVEVIIRPIYLRAHDFEIMYNRDNVFGNYQ